MRYATLEELTSPVTSTSVATKGAEESATAGVQPEPAQQQRQERTG